MDSRSKWNHKYKERLTEHVDPTPNDRLKQFTPYLKGGTALDLACGLGGNSLYLAGNGYQVDALDVSDIAVAFVKQQAEQQKLPVIVTLCDLTEPEKLNLGAGYYDLVVIAYYLDRTLFPLVKAIVKDNGYFFMETFFMSPVQAKEGVSEQYKLQPGELLTLFADWQILYYEENEQEGRQTILVRKKGS